MKLFTKRKDEIREAEKDLIIQKLWKRLNGIGTPEKLGFEISLFRELEREKRLVHHTRRVHHTHLMRCGRLYAGEHREEHLFQLREFHELGRREIQENEERRLQNRELLAGSHA